MRERPSRLAGLATATLIATVCLGLWFHGGVTVTDSTEQATDRSDAQLVVEQPVTDVGSVLQGERVKATITVSNRGSTDLTIRADEGSCPCTRVTGSRSLLLRPGASDTIGVDLDTTLLAGTVQLPISLYTNDPRVTKTTVEVRATVVELFSYEPRAVDFGSVPSGSSVTRLLTIAGKRQWQPVHVTSTNKAITAEVRPLQPSQVFVLELRVLQDAAGGTHFGNAVIQTGRPDIAELRIPLQVHIASPVASSSPARGTSRE